MFYNIRMANKIGKVAFFYHFSVFFVYIPFQDSAPGQCFPFYMRKIHIRRNLFGTTFVSWLVIGVEMYKNGKDFENSNKVLLKMVWNVRIYLSKVVLYQRTNRRIPKFLKKDKLRYRAKSPKLNKETTTYRRLCVMQSLLFLSENKRKIGEKSSHFGKTFISCTRYEL